MKLNPLGRAALLACATVVLGLGISSCATSTLGYLYATTTQYGEIASMRLDINSGAIKGVSCNTHNGDQQDCVVGSSGGNPTKLISAQGNTYLYVLNALGNGVTQATVSVFSLGPSGGVYATGDTYTSTGQNPIDMYLNPGGGYLYVLDQFQPATVAGCANPTPATCAGDITVFAVGNNGSLNVVQNQQNGQPFFPIGYIPDPVINQAGGTPTPNLPNGVIGSHMLVSGSTFYVLDEAVAGNVTSQQIDAYEIQSTGTLAGQLQTSTSAPPTPNSQFVAPTAIVSGGGFVFISDSVTGAIWTYRPNNGTLTPYGDNYYCPTVPTGTAVLSGNCAVDPQAPAPGGLPTALSALLIDPSGQYLYATDYNNGVVFSMQIFTTAATGSVLGATTNGGYASLGTNATCMTISSGTEFLYVSGTGNVSGVQIDTNSGNLSSNDHPTTQATFTGVVPCLTFSPRT